MDTLQKKLNTSENNPECIFAFFPFPKTRPVYEALGNTYNHAVAQKTFFAHVKRIFFGNFGKRNYATVFT